MRANKAKQEFSTLRRYLRRMFSLSPYFTYTSILIFFSTSLKKYQLHLSTFEHVN